MARRKAASGMKPVNGRSDTASISDRRKRKMEARTLNNAKKRRRTRSSGDPRLILRIKQGIESKKHSNRLVIVDEVLADLQSTYPEYRRTKQHVLKTAIMKVLSTSPPANSTLTPSSQQEGTNEDSDLSDSDKYVQYEDTNLVNKSLSELYKQTPTTPKSKPDGENSHHDEEEKPRRQASIPGSSAKKRKKKAADIPVQECSVTFDDLGGMKSALIEVCKLLLPVKHPEVFTILGGKPPRGILLHGPPGCGKTLLAHAIAGELKLPFIKLASTELVSGVSGESEEKIRDLFEKAVNSAPCVLFLDEIDAIAPKRETAQKDMERRIVSQLLVCMDDLNQKEASMQVLVIGATNRPDSLDPALRRPGRFDQEISLGMPDELARKNILQVLCRDLRIALGLDFNSLALKTPGYVGADLMALKSKALMCAVYRVFAGLQESMPSGDEPKDSSGAGDKEFQSALSLLRDQQPFSDEQLETMFVEMQDFEDALKVVQPSAKREGFATVPSVTWDDVGALRNVRKKLGRAILFRIRHKKECEKMGIKPSGGIIFCGPPGCGKTLLAKALANECGINFISVKGPELLNMYVGESERAVRQCFQRARNSAPCVIFFDEIDSLCPRRSDIADGGASNRVVNTMLTELDGLEARKQVFVMAATNRLEIIDPAMLRPGRFGTKIFVDLPSPEDRLDILRTITKTEPELADDVDLREISYDSRCQRFSGADLAELVQIASMIALEEHLASQSAENANGDTVAVPKVHKKHFELAFREVKASTSLEALKRYERSKRMIEEEQCAEEKGDSEVSNEVTKR